MVYVRREKVQIGAERGSAARNSVDIRRYYLRAATKVLAEILQIFSCSWPESLNLQLKQQPKSNYERYSRYQAD